MQGTPEPAGLDWCNQIALDQAPFDACAGNIRRLRPIRPSICTSRHQFRRYFATTKLQTVVCCLMVGRRTTDEERDCLLPGLERAAPPLPSWGLKPSELPSAGSPKRRK